MRAQVSRGVPAAPTAATAQTAGHVAASDGRFVLGIILAVLVITSLPYAYAYLSSPPDRQFTGILLDVPDHAQYFSWMRELGQSNLAANKLTPEVNRPAFFNLLWWMLGRIGRWAGWGFAPVYHLLRVAAASAFLWTAYRICSWFFPDRPRRRLGFLIVTFTSGFGWVLVVLKYTLANGVLLRPMDLFTAEANTFLGVMGYPHFVAAAVYVLVFDLLLRGEAKSSLRYAVAAGVLALFLGWQHAYDLASVYAVLLAYLVLRTIRDRRVPRYLVASSLVIGGLSFWPALYSVWLTQVDPVWKGVLSQFANAGVFSPAPLDLMILMGPAFLLAVFALIRSQPWRLRSQSNNEVFLAGWFLSYFVLIYLPVDFQVHLLNGWQVPIALLATTAVFRDVIPWISRRLRVAGEPASSRMRTAVAAILIASILPTNVYLLAWRFYDLSRHDYPFYVSTDDTRAFDWLETNARSQDVVLSSLTIGQFLPAWTGTNAFLAHWAETLDFFGKVEAVKRFYAVDSPNAERQALLERFSVDYVYQGRPERALGSFDPARASYLALVFESPDVRIYSVRHP